VFDPFFSTKKDEGREGLGLAVAYGIVRSLGGDIQIESEPGAGTRVTMWLRAAKG
jgi:signal transduction histidine kinase